MANLTVSSCYNPMFYNGRKIHEIRLYHPETQTEFIKYKDRPHVQIKWFDALKTVRDDGTFFFMSWGNNTLHRDGRKALNLDFEILNRRKIKLDGKAFTVPRKKDHYERHDSFNHCVLYIPFDLMEFDEIVKDWKTTHFDKHTQIKSVYYSNKYRVGVIQNRDIVTPDN